MVPLGKGLPAAALFWPGEGQDSDTGFRLGWGRGEGWSLVLGERAGAELSARPSGVRGHLEPPWHRRSPPHASYDHHFLSDSKGLSNSMHRLERLLLVWKQFVIFLSTLPR